MTKNKKITIQFSNGDNNISSIKCLKIFTEEHFNKIKNKVSLIKEGGILYPSRFAKNVNKNSIFVSKDGKIVKEKKDSFYVIETTSNTIKEIKDCTDVKIYSEFKHIGRQPPRISKEAIEERKIEDPVSLLGAKSLTEQEIKKCDCDKYSEIKVLAIPIVEKDEIIVDKLVNEKITKKSEPITWKEVKDRSMEALKKAEQARVGAVEAEAKIETISEEKKIEEPVIVEIKTQTEDEKLDGVLTSVLESIKRKADSEKENPKENKEVEKLRLELMRKKLELIETFLKANKDE